MFTQSSNIVFQKIEPSTPTPKLDSSDVSLPILDISDPCQLLELLSAGEAVVEDILPGTEELSLASSIDSLFLPPKIEQRPESKRQSKAKCTSHKLLTSIEVLEQKQALLYKKK